METEPTPQYLEQPPPLKPGGGGVKKAAGPLAVLGALALKFKFAIFAVLKFLPMILKTGGTMVLSIGAYALLWGWWFALGFVLLIFVHECGHLIVAKRLGLKVSAPMFIPFMGAVIMLREAPRNAWIESLVGIGGPMLGTVGAVACYGLYQVTGNPMFSALAYSGFFINLFNLAPIGFLDGGRIATALSPWLWVVGFVVMIAMLFVHFNFLIVLILFMSLPRLFSLFRKKTPEQLRYFEVTPMQRLIMGGMYFGLIAFLMLAMLVSQIDVSQVHPKAVAFLETLLKNGPLLF